MKTYKLEIERYSTYLDTTVVEIEASSFEEAKNIAFHLANDDDVGEWDKDIEPNIEFKAYEVK